jgi:hypothetical protein
VESAIVAFSHTLPLPHDYVHVVGGHVEALEVVGPSARCSDSRLYALAESLYNTLCKAEDARLSTAIAWMFRVWVEGHLLDLYKYVYRFGYRQVVCLVMWASS